MKRSYKNAIIVGCSYATISYVLCGFPSNGSGGIWLTYVVWNLPVVIMWPLNAIAQEVPHMLGIRFVPPAWVVFPAALIADSLFCMLFVYFKKKRFSVLKIQYQWMRYGLAFLLAVLILAVSVILIHLTS